MSARTGRIGVAFVTLFVTRSVTLDVGTVAAPTTSRSCAVEART